MPGPVSRADLYSIEKHLHAISPMGQEMVHFYVTLCMRTVALAEEAGGIDDKQASQFRTLLQQAEDE
jgi:predicted short-subunit dehydrogenase-like oxidoreductase (DUF2520 family)